MGVYEEIAGAFLKLPCVVDWPEVCALFENAAARQPGHWLLPVRGCQAVGGTPEQAIPAAVAVACSHLSIVLVDDMLDDDPRGAYHESGPAAAANMACALQAAGLAALAGCPAPPKNRLAALAGMNAMSLATCLGQYWDGGQAADEAGYWRVVRAKSSPFFGAALQMGGLVAGTSPASAQRLKEFGELYGEMIQIHDDVADSLAVPANPDWLQQRCPLPILFARSVRHPEQARFVELCTRISDPLALQEAQDILIRCGAVSYCVDQLLSRHGQMRAMLDATPLQDRGSLEQLAEAVIAPVYKLFEEMESRP